MSSASESPFEIAEAKEDDLTAELVSAFAGLVPQLSSTASPPTKEDLAAIIGSQVVGSQGSFLFLARNSAGAEGEEVGNKIVGSLTLVVFRIPTGLRARIEDVVVDEAFQNSGLGQALSETAFEKAKTMGATSIDLTSKPEREAANSLYQKLGFYKRDTNIYRKDL